MVEYKCLRCNKVFNHKTKFVKHLKRKFICKPLIKDISIKDVYNIYFKIDKNNDNTQYQPMLPDVTQMLPDVTQMLPDVTQMLPDVTRNVTRKTLKNNNCRYCNRSFASRHGKCRHEKNRCKVNVSNNSQIIDNEIREKLLEEFVESGQLVKADQQLTTKGNISIDTSQNNSGTINNITISLNSYDNTDKSYIKNTDILTCIKKGNMGIPHLIHLLHCNKYKPENHNVSLNNIKSSYIGVYNGKKWDYEMQFELIDMMAEDCINMIEDRVAEWDDKYYKKHKSIIDKFPHFQYKYYDSKYVKKRVHEEAKLKLFNNRDLIMNTRNKLLEMNSCKTLTA
jgi:hypothetical protein